MMDDQTLGIHMSAIEEKCQTFEMLSSKLGIGKYVGVWDAIGVQFLHLFPQLMTFLNMNWVEKV